MLLFYVDECGDAKAWDEAQAAAGPGPSPWFVLAAVGIRDTSREPLANFLLTLKARRFGADDKQPWSHSEIKGRYLAQAGRALRQGTVPARAALRQAFGSAGAERHSLAQLSGVFTRFRPLIFVAAVDKARLASVAPEVDPLGAAYALLHERVAQTLGSVAAGEGAAFVADQQVEHEAYFRDGRMTAARSALASRLHAVPEYRRLLDKPLWIDTALSEWDREILQLPDIVAYSAYETCKSGVAPKDPFYLWPAIEAGLARNWGTGKIANGGLSIFPTRPANEYPRLGAELDE